MAPITWRRRKLGTLVDTISDTYQFDAKPVVFLNTSDILGGRVLNRTLVPSDNLPGQAKKSIQRGDFLFSEIRPANRRFALIDFDAKEYVVSTKLMVLRTKGEIIPDFLKLTLTSTVILDYLQMIAESRSGTFPQITFDQIAELDIMLPSPDEQRAIAGVSGALDDKFELNRQMNETLEALAQGQKTVEEEKASA
jgi:type I restriction enzyme S subunit